MGSGDELSGTHVHKSEQSMFFEKDWQCVSPYRISSPA